MESSTPSFPQSKRYFFCFICCISAEFVQNQRLAEVTWVWSSPFSIQMLNLTASLLGKTRRPSGSISSPSQQGFHSRSFSPLQEVTRPNPCPAPFAKNVQASLPRPVWMLTQRLWIRTSQANPWLISSFIPNFGAPWTHPNHCPLMILICTLDFTLVNQWRQKTNPHECFQPPFLASIFERQRGLFCRILQDSFSRVHGAWHARWINK